MPYKSEKIPIAGTEFDRRVKLSPEQKQAIKILNKEGYSQRKLAKMFGCSKRSIQNILHTQGHALCKRLPTAYRTEKQREYRNHKQKLYKLGIIKLHQIKAKKK